MMFWVTKYSEMSDGLCSPGEGRSGLAFEIELISLVLPDRHSSLHIMSVCVQDLSIASSRPSTVDTVAIMYYSPTRMVPS